MAVISLQPLRREAPAWAEEPHFEPSAIRRAIEDIERAAKTAAKSALPARMDVRSDLAGFTVADARRALAGLPAPGDYEVVVKPLRYRTSPHLSALCEFDVRRIILRVPEPFRAFDELVYHSARRKPVPGMRFVWVSENVRFRTRRDVLREMHGRRSGAETACDRFALRPFRRGRVTADDALEALRGCRSQPVPVLRLAA